MIITHDFHIHTNLSLCAAKEATLEMYARKAKELGLKKMAITNHLWDHVIPDWEREENVEFYSVQDVPYISRIKDELKALNNGVTEFLFGSEAEYSFEHRKPAISVEAAEQMDVLLVPNSHTHLTMPKSFYYPPQKHADYMVDAFMDIVNSDVEKYITAIPHPFLAVCCPYDNRELLALISDDEFKACFTAAAEKNIALELNPNYIKGKTLAEAYSDPILRMFKIGKECGCKFTVGSDAHSEAGLENFRNIYILTALLELKEDDICSLAR